ncbi:MAG: hypothetical protein HY805_09535 [Nitrospirae bacterium]|nr:hypothetical protein [Nitrospirota bacterium]
MGRNLLVVSSSAGISDDSLSYALELVKMTRRGMAVLMVYRKKLSERFEDFMTAVTFAEANEDETAREMLKDKASKKDEEKQLHDIKEKCKDSGITLNIFAVSDDIPSAVRDLLKQDKSIDLVLLGTDITGNGMAVRDLKKLLKIVSVPIVTLARLNKTHMNKQVEAA